MNTTIKNWINREKINVAKIRISNIIGFEDDGQTIFNGRADNIFDELSLLFNSEDNNEYTGRSVSMLDYSKEETLTRLQESFKEQPIMVKDAGNGLYSISGNGKHRFTLLKALYLAELSQIDSTKLELRKVI